MSEKKETETDFDCYFRRQVEDVLWKEADVAAARDLEYLEYLQGLPHYERPRDLPADPVARLYRTWGAR